MGWLFTPGSTKAEVIHEVTRDHDNVRYLARSIRGNCLWTVVETKGAGTDAVVSRFVVLYLLEHDGDGWGYKGMDESMGPGYHDCPLSYLDMLTEPINEFSRAWREKVREYHRVNAMPKVKVGDRVRLGPQHMNLVLTLARRNGRGWHTANGFRLTPRNLRGAVVLEGENS